MDAFFQDPNGWVLQKERGRKLGGLEDLDYNAPTGVQKRPVFSVVWAGFCFWLFFSFFPTRIGELGGFKPSAIENGVCTYTTSVSEGGGKRICTGRIGGTNPFAEGRDGPGR